MSSAKPLITLCATRSRMAAHAGCSGRSPAGSLLKLTQRFSCGPSPWLAAAPWSGSPAPAGTVTPSGVLAACTVRQTSRQADLALAAGAGRVGGNQADGMRAGGTPHRNEVGHPPAKRVAQDDKIVSQSCGLILVSPHAWRAAATASAKRYPAGGMKTGAGWAPVGREWYDRSGIPLPEGEETPPCSSTSTATRARAS